MKYKQLNLNLLVVLGVLLREKSVSKASMRLNLTQAAVSVHLSKLRAHFEDELLVLPPGRKVELTELAMRLIEPVSEFLDRTKSLIDMRSSFVPGESTRRFSIATADAEAAVILTRLSRRLATEAPGIQIQFREIRPSGALESAAVADFIEQDRADFVIVPRGVHSQRHSFDVLYSQPYVCVVCADNPLVGPTLSEAQYLDLTHVVRVFGEDECSTYDAMQIHARGLARKIGPIVETYMLMPEMLIGTPYIATLHAKLAEDLCRRYPLRILPCPIRLSDVESLLQWRSRYDSDPGALWLRAMLHDVAVSEVQQLAA